MDDSGGKEGVIYIYRVVGSTELEGRSVEAWVDMRMTVGAEIGGEKEEELGAVSKFVILLGAS